MNEDSNDQKIDMAKKALNQVQDTRPIIPASGLYEFIKNELAKDPKERVLDFFVGDEKIEKITHKKSGAEIQRTKNTWEIDTKPLTKIQAIKPFIWEGCDFDQDQRENDKHIEYSFEIDFGLKNLKLKSLDDSLEKEKITIIKVSQTSAKCQRKFLDRVSFKDVYFSEKADFRNALFSEEAGFWGAKFSGRANFYKVIFSKDVSFGGAHFIKEAHFRDVQFCEKANFMSVKFSGGADFFRVEFRKKVEFVSGEFGKSTQFSEAKFSEEADFGYAQFSGQTMFSVAKFNEGVDFWRAQFNGETNFVLAQFSEIAHFFITEFSGKTNFKGAQFKKGASFEQATLSGLIEFGEAKFYQRLWLNSIFLLTGEKLELNFDECLLEKGINLSLADENRYKDLILGLYHTAIDPQMFVCDDQNLKDITLSKEENFRKTKNPKGREAYKNDIEAIIQEKRFFRQILLNLFWVEAADDEYFKIMHYVSKLEKNWLRKIPNWIYEKCFGWGVQLWRIPVVSGIIILGFWLVYGLMKWINIPIHSQFACRVIPVPSLNFENFLLSMRIFLSVENEVQYSIPMLIEASLGIFIITVFVAIISRKFMKW